MHDSSIGQTGRVHCYRPDSSSQAVWVKEQWIWTALQVCSCFALLKWHKEAKLYQGVWPWEWKFKEHWLKLMHTSQTWIKHAIIIFVLNISWKQMSFFFSPPNGRIEQFSKTKKCCLRDWGFIIVLMFFNVFQLCWGVEGWKFWDVAICVVFVVSPYLKILEIAKNQFELSRFIVQFLDFPG